MVKHMAPKPAHKDEEATAALRRHKMVEAAWLLLDEEGLTGLTVRAVLARTGLARRAFYDLFDSKDDLMLAVFERSLRAAADYFSSHIINHPDAISRLRLIVYAIVLGRASISGQQHWEKSRRSAALAREHLRLAETRPKDLERAIAPLINVIAEILRCGMADGSIRTTEPQHLALLVYNLISTTVHGELLAEELGQPSLDRRKRLAEEIWHFCRGAVSA
jgi:AcrR family transcriptional regulator